MDKFLFRVSTVKKSAWGNAKPKPIYVVAENKDDAISMVSKMIVSDLQVSKVQKLATQNANIIFVGL
jgi:hypothetical protein